MEHTTQDSPWFFGYGSLVNRRTHDYPDARPAELEGWRRSWVQTGARDFCFLSALPVEGGSIEGLVARVPNADWAALDKREASYRRQKIEHSVRCDGLTGDIHVYSVPREDFDLAASPKAILLSYLDVVFSGYEKVFGRDGVKRFIATTDGWERPIFNDRADPIYPRHQTLPDRERAWIDALLSETTAVFMMA